ncbi:hypothetical protein [Longispora urticae]
MHPLFSPRPSTVTASTGRRRPHLAAALLVLVGAVSACSADQPDPARGPTAAASVVRSAFDPMRLRLRVGWTPDDVPTVTTGTGTTHQSVFYARRDGLLNINVTAYAPGFTPDERGQAPLETHPAPPVGDKPSTWDTGGTLTWQWAPGARATVRVTGNDSGTDAETRVIAQRVAASVTMDGDKPVTLPFTVPAPAGLPVSATDVVTQPDGTYRTTLTFSDKSIWVDRDPNKAEVWVRVDKAAHREGDKRGPATATTDGHPTILLGHTVVFLDVSGHRVEAATLTPSAATRLPEAQLTTLLRGLRVTPQAWTATPVTP